jgi:hypothetical protein
MQLGFKRRGFNNLFLTKNKIVVLEKKLKKIALCLTRGLTGYKLTRLIKFDLDNCF